MLMSRSQFCGTFFHVPEIRFGPEYVCAKHCLDGSCLVGQQRNLRSQPRTVDALVVIKTETNQVLRSFMYRNRRDASNTVHAEEFFYEDLKSGSLRNTLYSYLWSSANESLEICMYITYQPCHYSTRKTPNKSCSDQMVELYEEILKPMNIKFVIKPILIYKAYWNPSTADFQTQPEILNAKKGIRRLFAAGIDIQAMEERDWIFLRDTLCSSSRICTCYNPYYRSEREKLDNFIRQEIIFEIMSCVKVVVQEAEETLLLAQRTIDTTTRTFYISRRIQASSRLQELRLQTKKHLSILRDNLFLIDSILRDIQSRRRMHDYKRARMLQHIHVIQKSMQSHLQQTHYYKDKVLDCLFKLRSNEHDPGAGYIYLQRARQTPRIRY